MGRFDGKVALVTGASAGIGAALSRELAREGADLVLAARREDRLRDLAAEIERMGRRAVAVSCDVTKDGDLERAVKIAKERLGRLDVAIANAGFGIAGRADEIGIEDFRRQMETNVFGVLRTFYATIAELKRNRGYFAVVGSVSGHIPTPDTSAYCMSKFAVRGWAESVRHELAGDGVSVTLISPGFVESEIRLIDNAGRLRADAKDPIPSWLVMPAEKAAREIVRAIAARRREAIITGHGKAFVFLYRYVPWLVRAAISWGASGARRRNLKLQKRPPEATS